jgi:hypothetical protein
MALQAEVDRTGVLPELRCFKCAVSKGHEHALSTNLCFAHSAATPNVDRDEVASVDLNHAQTHTTSWVGVTLTVRGLRAPCAHELNDWAC